MRVECLHGYYLFKEMKVGQVSDFTWITGIELVKKKDYFTFPDLVDAPKYSIKGMSILDAIAVDTFEGSEAEVFEQNGIVYDISKGIVTLIGAVQNIVEIYQAGNRFVASGLIMAGSRTTTGKIVKNFSGFFSKDVQKWTYSVIDYV